MTWAAWIPFLLSAAKAVFVVMFAMNLGVVLTWADRRQGAMMQDRVGPDRAVIWLPKPAAIGMAVVPALGIAAAVSVLALRGLPEVGPVSSGLAALFSQLGIFMTWVTLLAVAGRVQVRGARHGVDRALANLGDPRRIFFGGLFAHGAALVLAVMFRGTPAGDTLQGVYYGAGAGLLVLSVLFGAAYSAHAMSQSERVGLRLAGLLHPAADGLKTLFKEDFIPPDGDRLLHGLAPFISFFPTLVLLACIPFGDTLCFGLTPEGGLDLGQVLSQVPRDGVCTQGAVTLQAVDLNVGILYIFARGGTGIVGAALAGWASNNKFSLMGGLRAASQMVSYEVALGLSIVGALMIYGTPRFDGMVKWQAENAWGVFVQPLGVVLFLAASLAESKRIPFDLPEGESEVVAGYFTEYSGMKFAMFFFSEYIAVVGISAVMATVFFGGFSMPFLERDGIVLAIGDQIYWQQGLQHVWVVIFGVIAFILKVVILCWFQLTLRWTLPRFRYDQLMRLGWQALLPLSLANILLTGLIILALDSASPLLVSGLKVIGDITGVLVVGAGLAGVISLVVFVLAPSRKKATPATSSARYATALGGRRTRPMGA